MGSFAQVTRSIGTTLRNTAVRAMVPRKRQVPGVFRSQFGQAQKRNIRRMTHQAAAVRPMRTRRIRPPMPGLYRPEIGRPSPNFGKLMPEYPTFKNFTLYRPRRAAAQQLFPTGPAWRYNEGARTFLTTRPKPPLTTLSRHEGAGLVGARSSITNREIL